jgi:flagellar FliL protein
MANTDDKTVVAGADAGAAADEPKKGGNKMLLFGGIGLGAIILGVVLAIFVIKPMMSGSDSSESSSSTETHKSESSHKSAKGKDGQSIIYAINNIVVNPAGTGGSRFLSVSLGFALDSPELEAEFSKNEPIIRDALITILASKTVAELTDTKQKEIARYQIKKRVSQLMHTDGLTGVYYTDFVLQ